MVRGWEKRPYVFDSSTLTSSLCRLRRSWHYLYIHTSADFLKTSWHNALKANLSHMRSWHTVYFLLLLLLLIVNVSDAGSVCWHVTCKSPLISHTSLQTTFAFTYSGRGGSETLMTWDSTPPAQFSPVYNMLIFSTSIISFIISSYFLLSLYMHGQGWNSGREIYIILLYVYSK